MSFFAFAKIRSASTRQSGAAGEIFVPRAPNTPWSARSATKRLTLGGAFRRPRRQAGLAHGLGDLAHFFGAAAAVFDHALEEVGALLLPIDRRKGFRERGQHRVLDAIGARGGEALDHHRLQPLDHDAAAHFGRRGDAELVARDLGVEAEHGEQRRQFGRRRGRRATAAPCCDRAAPRSSPRLRHSGRGRPNPRPGAQLGAGRGRIEIEKPGALGRIAPAQALRHRHGLARRHRGDDEIGAARRDSACEADKRRRHGSPRGPAAARPVVVRA